MQLSTVISDGVLAIAALSVGGVLALRAPGRGWLGGVGLGLIGLAATVGALRFADVAPDTLTPLHQGLSTGAAAVGLPAVGLAWLVPGYRLPLAAGWWALIASASIAVITSILGQDGYATVAGTWSMAAVIAAAMKIKGGPGAMGAVGAVLIALGGLAIGTEGAWFGILRIDWFHGVMTIASVLLGIGLLRAQTVPESDPAARPR